MAGVAATPEVASDEDPTVFDGDDRGDLGRGELGPLGSVPRDAESERSFDGLKVVAFCCTPFGMDSGVGFMASVATEEATSSSAQSEEGESSFLGCFETEAKALESAPILFFLELPS